MPRANASVARRDDGQRRYFGAASWPCLQHPIDARSVAVDADWGGGPAVDLDKESGAAEFNGSCGLLLKRARRRFLWAGDGP